MRVDSLPPREQKRASQPLEIGTEEGSFSGYASLFGKTDLGNDCVEKGAFARALRGRKTSGVRMLFQHDPASPIGVWDEIREDAKGLFVKGRIISTTSKGAEVLELIRAGAIDGLSIGFRTQKSRTDRKTGIRKILEADLWEISIVTFPMLPQARVAQVKTQCVSDNHSWPTVREFEHWLTRDAGLSRSEARVVISKGFATLADRRDAEGTRSRGLLQKMRKATGKFKTFYN